MLFGFLKKGITLNDFDAHKLPRTQTFLSVRKGDIQSSINQLPILLLLGLCGTSWLKTACTLYYVAIAVHDIQLIT